MDISKIEAYNFYGNLFNKATWTRYHELLINTDEDHKRDTMKRSIWDIGNGKFKSKYWYCFFPHLVLAVCLRLHIDSNNHPLIIKDLATTKWINLVHVDLSKNNITNIEGLAFLEMENMTAIFLDHNNITQLKALNKVCWKRLQLVLIKFNLIPEQEFNGSRVRYDFTNEDDKHKERIFRQIFKNSHTNLKYISYPKMQVGIFLTETRLKPEQPYQTDQADTIQRIKRPKLENVIIKKYNFE